MHITLESDYAVRIVHCLAVENRRMDAGSIAEYTGVTLRFSLKILRKLVGGGIIRSFKGAHGGYELARPAEQITLGQVIETVEGPFVISRCLHPSFSCTCATPCKFQNVYNEISELVRQRLSQVNFANLQ